MMRSTIAFVVLSISTHVALADRCADAQRRLHDFAIQARAVNEHGVDAALTCMFGGSDDKAVERIGKEMTALYDALRPIFEKKVAFDSRGCMKNGHTGQQGFDLSVKLAAVGVGATHAACSAKVNARAAELATKGGTDDQIEAETERLVQAWLTTLIPAWMSKT